MNRRFLKQILLYRAISQNIVGLVAHSIVFYKLEKEAIQHPVDTTMTASAGFVIGRGVQSARLAVESVGGRVGAAAKVAEVAFGVAPLVYMGHHIYNANDSAKEAGKVIFDAGLFMATASAGRVVH